MNSNATRRAFDDKIRRGIFQPVARFLPEDVREDRLQDAIAQTWAMYERYAERGELLDDAILVYSCRLRATDASRHYVPCEGYQRKRDALDPRNFMGGHVEVLRFGDFANEDEHRGPDEDEAPLGFGLAEAMSANPTRRILSAIDLDAWLAELPPEDRRMLAFRAAGHTLGETTDELGLSISTVFLNCKRLGLALAQRTGARIELKKKRKARLSSGSATAPKSSRVQQRPVMKKTGARHVPRASATRSREMSAAA